MVEEPTSESHVIVQFGRAVTEDDLNRLKQDQDVVEARMMSADVVDEDHIHVHPA